jgi:DNA-binding IclR family transcriptional regulator
MAGSGSAASPLSEQELAVLRAVRVAPDSGLREIAAAVGLPRTNFGRRLSRRLREPVGRLVESGLVVQRGDRYRLSERGRRVLADVALAGRR